MGASTSQIITGILQGLALAPGLIAQTQAAIGQLKELTDKGQQPTPEDINRIVADIQRDSGYIQALD